MRTGQRLNLITKDCLTAYRGHTICELYECNSWDFHINLTFNREWHNCKDLDKLKKDLGKWINNYTKWTDGKKLNYILIPELRRGAWHFHGVIQGLPPEHVALFERGKKHPKYLIENGYLNWELYQKKFGFCSLRKTRNGKAGLPTYATKDILKKTRRKKDCKLYTNSQGLNRFEKVCQGENLIPDIDFDFEGKYAGIKTLRIKSISNIFDL